MIRTELVKGQANDLNYQAELAATLQQLGTMLRAGGKVIESRAMLEQARSRAARVVERNPDNMDYRHLLNESCHALALTLLDQGKLPEALTALEQALQHGRVACDRAAEATPRDPRTSSDLRLNAALPGRPTLRPHGPVPQPVRPLPARPEVGVGRPGRQARVVHGAADGEVVQVLERVARQAE